MKPTRITLVIGAASLLSLVAACTFSPKQTYPPTRTQDIVENLHGTQVADPYRWLEDDQDPEVDAWQASQNAFTRKMLDAYPKTRAEIKEYLKKSYVSEWVSSPRIFGTKHFYSRRTKDQNRSVLYVKDMTDGIERVLFDPNSYPEDEAISMPWSEPCKDGSLMIFALDRGGRETASLHIMNVDTGEWLSEDIPNVRGTGIVWDEDNKGFLYSRCPEPGTVPREEEAFHRRVYYHKIGDDFHNDELIIGNGLVREAHITPIETSDRNYHFILYSRDWTAENYMIRKDGEKEFKWMAIEYRANFIPDVYDGKLICRTNFDAPRYRIMVGDPDNPGYENWTELIPQQKGVMRDSLIAGGKLIVNVMEDVHSRLFIYNLDGTLDREIKLPMLGSVGGFNAQPDQPVFYFSFSSFTFPYTTFSYNVNTHEMKVFYQKESDLNPDDYTVKQIWYASKDGTQVPMYVMHKKGITLDGNNPTILDAYGGFNVSILPGYLGSRALWLDRGGVMAIANIRGGGEFGATWHHAGRRENKQNCFDDYFAAAEKLIADGYTNPSKLVGTGGSNGGLLMGAAITQRPELFRAICCGVPLLDMIRYHLHETASVYTPEYGDPDKAEEFKWLISYSPYHNVKPGTKYPACFFTAGKNDARVDPMHASKMTALMQAATGSDKPILLWIESNTGHGGGATLDRRLEQGVDHWIFILSQLGMIEE